MTLKEARHLARIAPDRFRLTAKMIRGDDKNTPLFIYKIEELRDFSVKWDCLYHSNPFGVGRNINQGGYGEWLFL